MLDTIKKEWEAKFTLLIFIGFALWWVILELTVKKDSDLNQLFAAYYGVIALLGAFWGIHISFKWGGIKSIMGRALFVFALGLFAQEFGQLAYSYYIYFLHIEVPYPSWGDLGYFGSIPLYIYGVILLARAAGVKMGFRSIANKIQAIVIPLIIITVGYVLFLQGYKFDWSKPLMIFLDLGYPLGEAIYISLAILTYLLSRGVLGGIMKKRILFIILALVIQFSADYTFLFQARNNTWYAGGVNDFMYLCSYFVMAMALLQFKTALRLIQQ